MSYSSRLLADLEDCYHAYENGPGSADDKTCPHCEVGVWSCRCQCLLCFYERYLWSVSSYVDMRGVTGRRILRSLDEDDRIVCPSDYGRLRKLTVSICRDIIPIILYCHECDFIKRNRHDECVCEKREMECRARAELLLED